MDSTDLGPVAGFCENGGEPYVYGISRSVWRLTSASPSPKRLRGVAHKHEGLYVNLSFCSLFEHLKDVFIISLNVEGFL
jgi:hypothetical protein